MNSLIFQTKDTIVVIFKWSCARGHVMGLWERNIYITTLPSATLVLSKEDLSEKRIAEKVERHLLVHTVY